MTSYLSPRGPNSRPGPSALIRGWTFCILTATLSLWLGLRPASGREVPGALPGAFSVSANGAAVYSIALDVPPGIGGMQPGLGLGYSSQAGNGLLGVGWQLSGLSGIARCQPTRAVDGFIAPIDYGATDRFCLDGQRLINVAGEYGGDGTVYRTELETWRRVVSHASEGQCGGGPCSFTVTLKSGATWIYGGDSGSITAAGKSAIRVWALTEARDLNGNYLRVSYTESPVAGSSAEDGQYYPERIEYTGNGDFAPRFAVVFSYQERSDPIFAWQAGSPIRTLGRLATIETRLDGTPIKRWQLGYSVGTASGRSRLETVTECGVASTEEVCLPATVLSFSDNPAPGFRAGEISTTGASSSALGYFPMDVNGDGLGDLLQAWDSAGALQLTAYLSNATGFEAGIDTATGGGVEAIEFLPMDLDGDGRTDLVQLWSEGGQLRLTPYLAQADGTFASGTTDSPNRGSAAFAFYPMDVNGDGRTDLVQAVDAAGELELITYLSTSDGFDGGTSSTTGSGADALTIIPLDANADGRIDLLQLWSRSGELQITAHLSDGIGFETAVESTTDAGSSHLGFYPLDVNSDGVTDLVQTWTSDQTLRLTTYLGHGDGSYGAGVDVDTGASSAAIGFWPMNMIGDPSTDLVQGFAGVDGSLRFHAYRPSGDRFLPVVLGAAGESTDHLAFWPLDVNGDGKADLVRGFVDASGHLAFEPLFADGPSPDLATSWTDGLGGRVRAEYLPISDPAVYSANLVEPVYPESPGVQTNQLLTPAVYPIEAVGGGRTHVVARYVKENDPAINPAPYAYAYAYRYGGARIDHDGRGWLGFERLERSAEENGQKTVRTFLQSFPETGLQQSAETLCGASPDPRCATPDTLLAASTTAYEIRVTATGVEPTGDQQVYEVLADTVTSEILSYGAPGVRLERQYDYNTFGDLVREVNVGAVDAAGTNLDSSDDVYTCYGYATDDSDGPWRYGYVSDRKVSSTADLCDDFRSDAFRRGIDYALSHTVYDVAQGTMNLLEQKAWDDVNRVYLATETYDYDRFGNPGKTRDPARAVTTTVWESGFHTYPDRVELPAVVGSPALKQSYGFDPRFGAQVAGQDLNGNVATVCLDELGRAIAAQGPVPVEIEPPPSDPNCVPASITGTAPFSQAQVITMTAGTLEHDELGLAQEGQVLQDWPSAETPPEARAWRGYRSYVDGLGRSFKTTAESDAGDIVRCAVFNSLGKIRQKSLPFYGSPSADCGADSETVPFWIDSSYDAYGRPVEVTYPTVGTARGTLAVAYPDAETTQFTMAAGSATPATKELHYRYVNGQKQVWKMVLPEQGNATTTFDMDPLGRMLAVTDPATPDNPQGVTTRYSYDSLSRVLTTDDPDQNTTGNPEVVAARYVYDTSGLLASTSDAAGQETRYAYDALGRPTVVSLADGAEIRNSYDQGENGRGMLTGTGLFEPAGETTTVTSSYAFTYDAYGNRQTTELTVTGEPAPYLSAATYDPLARVRRFRYADGSELEREFIQGRLRSVFLGSAPVVSYFDYTAQGKPREVVYGNDVVTRYEYSALGQMVRQSIARPALNGIVLGAADSGAAGPGAIGSDAVGLGEEVLLDQTLIWNELHELVRLEDQLSSDGSWTYGYTNRRLAQATQEGAHPRSLAYAYDVSGNLTAKDGIAFDYAAHRVTAGWDGETKVLEVDYDPAGNTSERRLLTEGLTWGYRYNSRAQLAAVDLNGAPVLALSYDALGRRLRKVRLDSDGEPELTQLAPGPGFEIRRYGDGSEETRKYLRGLANTVAVVTSDTGGDEILYLSSNHLGSVSLGTDAAAVPQLAMAFLPWGEPDLEVTTRPPDFDRPTFQGREFDQASGLYDFGARYYQPTQGRFLTPDNQLGSGSLTPDAWNRFAFALNSPMVYVDPTGHSILQGVVGGLIGGLEIAAGIAIDVASGGSLEMVGGALIGAGVNGLTYSVTHTGNFSWKQYGVQEGVGAAIGLVTAGVGELFAAGAEAVAEVGEDLAADVAEDVFGDAMGDAGGATDDVLASTDTEAGAAADEDVFSAADDAGGGDGEACAASFAEGTLIATADGLLAIEDLRPGDFVVAADEASGEQGLYEITHAFERSSPLTVELELANETLTTTLEHPFWVVGESWTAARDLKAGTEVVLRSGATTELTAVTMTGGTARVFNIEVNEVHNYFVGESGAWVHNPLCNLADADDGQRETFDQMWDEVDRYVAEDDRNRGVVSIGRNSETGEFRRGFNSQSRGRGRGRIADSETQRRLAGEGPNGRQFLSCAESHLCFRMERAGELGNTGVTDVATFRVIRQPGRVIIRFMQPCENCLTWAPETFRNVFTFFEN